MKYYYQAPTQWGIESDGGVTTEDIWQGYKPSCAVHSQYHILKDYGFNGSVDDLIQEATEKGWYDPETGTPLEHVGKLLELHGVDCNMYVNATELNLVSELAQGKRVIVSVDSDELWGNEGPFAQILDKLGLDFGGDHALVVSGYDCSDPKNPTVILTDSGTGQAAAPYPLKDFVEAWEDGNCTMIVPEQSPTEYAASRSGDSFLTDSLASNIPEGDWQTTNSIQEMLDIIDAIAFGKPINVALDVSQNGFAGDVADDTLATHQGAVADVASDVIFGTHQGIGGETDDFLGTHQGSQQAGCSDNDLDDVETEVDSSGDIVSDTF